MLTRMLESLGLFMGWRKQGDHEATFFLELNDWLFEQCRAGWDNPAPLEHLLRDAELRALALDYLRLSVASPRSLAFRGPKRAFARLPLAEPWGWKDPRTTFTLPLWRELYPGARLIEMRRHGVDVAQSLRVRHQRIVGARAKRYQRMKPWFRFIARRSRLTTSARCAVLESGFALWEEYCAESDRQLRDHEGPTLQIRYEDFMAHPAERLREVAEFCGLQPTREQIASVAAGALEAGAYAYAGKPELRGFAEANETRLVRFGYSSQGDPR